MTIHKVLGVPATWYWHNHSYYKKSAKSPLPAEDLADFFWPFAGKSKLKVQTSNISQPSSVRSLVLKLMPTLCRRRPHDGDFKSPPNGSR